MSKTLPQPIDNSADVIDIRDVFARIDYLAGDPHPDDELTALRALVEECAGNGGDEERDGIWYPVTLIRDSYFQEYAQELADECGLINREVSWPYTCIDWDKAARELRMDYTAIDFDCVTYWIR